MQSKNDWIVWFWSLSGLLFLCYVFYRFVTTGEILGPRGTGFLSFSDDRFLFVVSIILYVLIFGVSVHLLIKPVKSIIDNFLPRHKKSSHHLVKKRKRKRKRKSN